jgi:hypothetical protein
MRCVGEESPTEAGGASSLELAGLTQQALAHVITDEASVTNSHLPSEFLRGIYALRGQACPCNFHDFIVQKFLVYS